VNTTVAGFGRRASGLSWTRATCIATLAAGLAAVSLTAAPRQQQLPSTPTFRSGVNLVTLDVVVRDKRTGRLVSNLTRNDFTVQDDNAPQAITSFAAVDLPDLRAIAGHSSGPQYAGNDVADGQMPDGRLVVFFINNSTIRAEATSYLRDWLHRYVDGHMTDEDQVAIWTARGTQPQQPLTSDRARLDTTIDRIKGEADLLPYRVPPRVTLTLLARLLDRLDTISNRRKVVIYFGALPITERSKQGRIFEDGLYGHVVQQAAAANVAIYPVHVTGVGGLMDITGAMSAAARGATPRGFAGGLPMSLLFLARQTGGLYYDRNDFDHVLDRIQEDAGHYYLLGFSPSVVDTKPGDFRRLRVTVNRPGAVVQARSGYIQVPTAATH
jgi:VWFA-related protein